MVGSQTDLFVLASPGTAVQLTLASFQKIKFLDNKPFGFT